MNSVDVWSLCISALALAIPATLALTAMSSPRRAELAGYAAVALAVAVTVTFVARPNETGSLGVCINGVTCVMLVLVSGLGAIIVRYSRRYLQGDADILRYLRALLFTLSAVTLLVASGNLLVIALAWTATSLALHQLLTFYARSAALISAHKKFIVGRSADLLLGTSLVLIQWHVGSLDLDRIAAWAAAHPDLPISMHVAAVLLVLAVALRSAQLPFHGWLLQVMEAPTPVSALLHAGVVNIGGLVLIRLAPWMNHATFAQTLLVCIGLVSTVVAALVMTTRVSVKVALAWSTCAQMGFMLVQCGLGLWHLALLHLVAHSLYKAHAFLSAGSAVEGWRIAAFTKPANLSLARVGMAFLVAVIVTALSVMAMRSFAGSDEPSVLWLAMLVGLSMIPLIARTKGGLIATLNVALRTGGVVLLYVAWHVLAAQVLPAQSEPSHVVLWALVGLGMTTLFALKTALHLWPEGRLARAAYPWLFAGLYLDEVFTRLTFRFWPPRLQPPDLSAHAPQMNVGLGAQS